MVQFSRSFTQSQQSIVFPCCKAALFCIASTELICVAPTIKEPTTNAPWGLRPALGSKSHSSLTNLQTHLQRYTVLNCWVVHVAHWHCTACTHSSATQTHPV